MTGWWYAEIITDHSNFIILISDSQNKGDGLISEETAVAVAVAVDSTVITTDDNDKAEKNEKVEESLKKKVSSDEIQIIPDLEGDLDIILLILFYLFYLFFILFMWLYYLICCFHKFSILYFILLISSLEIKSCHQIILFPHQIEYYNDSNFSFLSINLISNSQIFLHIFFNIFQIYLKAN